MSAGSSVRERLSVGDRMAIEGPLHKAVLSALDFGVVRSPGSDFGNLLFPIARSLIGQATMGGTLVYPTMRQIKIGTYLRREPDKRTYGGIVRGRSMADWRIWIESMARRQVDEDAVAADDVTITYTGLKKFFHDLVGYEALISNWISTNRIDKAGDRMPIDIGLHIRRGDFTENKTGSAGQSMQIPTHWYRQAFLHARDLLKIDRPRVVLFTDGDPARLASELNIENVEVDAADDALSSILNLSRARVIVGSRSTFSKWAVFLGGSVAIWDAAYDISPYWPVRPDKDIFL
ncbi:hypothetical protein [Rhizorhabdus dicambivorans]|uniref:Glycosyl transferase family 11 n=2 Tax=Rhizorhabdus dicambivorans TaxID=1850238 RepID=A0A2A4FQM5_9SPHN|nr:hypothetical protein [Rhizorhabdus dicambivorans]ATE66188.1 hypothetical protein CMV14_18750 [Rhizorhabdus dicambivorans]PCE39748.1 hypothetical protein COO09_23920 [Rhizorhabdus dicambivorans]